LILTSCPLKIELKDSKWYLACGQGKKYWSYKCGFFIRGVFFLQQSCENIPNALGMLKFYLLILMS